MPWRLKIFSGNNGCFESPQQIVKRLAVIVALQPWKDDHRTRRNDAIQKFFVLAKEFENERRVRLDYRSRASFKFVQAPERRRRQRVAWHRAGDAEQIVQSSAFLGQLRLAQYPSAAQSAQPVTFRQAAGRYELRAKRGGHGRRVLKEDVAVDFITQSARACVAGDLSDFPERCRLDGDAARVVGAGNNDQSGSRGDRAFHFINIDTIAVLDAALEAFDLGAQIFQRA